MSRFSIRRSTPTAITAVQFKDYMKQALVACLSGTKFDHENIEDFETTNLLSALTIAVLGDKIELTHKAMSYKIILSVTDASIIVTGESGQVLETISLTGVIKVSLQVLLSPTRLFVVVRVTTASATSSQMTGLSMAISPTDRYVLELGTASAIKLSSSVIAANLVNDSLVPRGQVIYHSSRKLQVRDAVVIAQGKFPFNISSPASMLVANMDLIDLGKIFMIGSREMLATQIGTQTVLVGI